MNLTVRNPMTLSRAQVAAQLEQMALQGSLVPQIRQVAASLLGGQLFTLPERLSRVWQWLPTKYVPDRDGDLWQQAILTLLTLCGDCEDWSILLAAVLKAMGICAQVGVMPNHAAVFVEIRQTTVWDLNAAPKHWKFVWHQHRQWVVLESTTPPSKRRAPGWDLDLVSPWLNTDLLIIPGI